MVKVKKNKIERKLKKPLVKSAKSRKVLRIKKLKKVNKVKFVKKAQVKKVVLKKKIKGKAKKSTTPKIILKQKKPVFQKKKKQIVKTEVTEFPAESLFKAKIKVVGIGGGGGSIVSEIGRSLEKATFVIADTDIRALKKKSGIKYFWFGEDLTHGLGTGVNVDLGRQAAEAAKDKISGIFKNQDIIIFIASLGGGLGSGATQVFAEAAKEFGGITFGIFTLPFKFEGKNKYRIAQNALRSLRQSLNVSLVIPNEKIFKVIDANTPITNAFSTVNKSLIESLESLIDLIYNPGVINIDFADLRTILRGTGNSAFLNTVEESGKNRVDKICEKILANPLLQGNNFEPEKILFNIAGAENLSMFEVEKISSHITNSNPKAKIIFGISKNPRLKNKIKTTILMTGGQAEEKVSVEKPEPVKEAVVEQIKILPKKEVVVVEKEKIPLTPVNTKRILALKTKRVTNKQKNKKTKEKKVSSPDKDLSPKQEDQNSVSFVPVFESQVPAVPVLEQKRMEIIEITSDSSKKTIRRSGLEIRKAEELQEKKRIAQEKEWEIPAFLRKVKFKS